MAAPALPVSGYIENASRLVSEQKQALEDIRDFVSRLPGGGALTELTIASGSITPSIRNNGSNYSVDTESDAASDTLSVAAQTNTIGGQYLTLRAENTARVVTIEHANGGSGEFLMRDALDFVLDTDAKRIKFEADGTSWVEIARDYGLGWSESHVFNNTQAQQFGQCRLEYSTADELKLLRHNGKWLFVAGQWYEIPSAGIAIDRTASVWDAGAGSNGLWYVYAYISSGAIVLEGSATARAADSTYGHQIKSGDATRTLVGMAYVTGSAFVWSSTAKLVASWFNRQAQFATRVLSGAKSTSATTATVLESAAIAEICCWGDERMHASGYGRMYNATVSFNAQAYVYINNSTFLGPVLAESGVSNGQNAWAITGGIDSPTEGYNYVRMRGAQQTGGGGANFPSNNWVTAEANI